MERFRNVLSVEDDARVVALLRHLDDACRRHDVDYVMDGGTLVGSMNHHGRIPWDDDVDVYVRAHDRRRLTRALQRNGFVVGSNGRYSKLWSVAFPRVDNRRPWNWPFVDIGWLVQNKTHSWEDRSVEARYRRNVYPTTWLFPSVRRPFGPLVLRAPRRSDLVLEHRFGRDWARTCVVNHWNHRTETWRYADAAENTRRPCGELDVDLVQRATYDNGTAVEWLANPRTGAVGPRRRFWHGSLVTHRASEWQL